MSMVNKVFEELRGNLEYRSVLDSEVLPLNIELILIARKPQSRRLSEELCIKRRIMSLQRGTHQMRGTTGWSLRGSTALHCV